MVKRKRGVADADGVAAKSHRPDAAASSRRATPQTTTTSDAASKSREQQGIDLAAVWSRDTATLQIVTGSYERVLHGFTATIPRALIDDQASPTADHGAQDADQDRGITFSDTFLFNAHASSIRCLALSPMPDNPNGNVTLATGSTDERINLFSLSLCPPAPAASRLKLPSLHGNSIAENSKNKELGSLLHHASTVTALHFPTRAKLLSAAEDSTIAITRTRDWMALSSIKAPIPKPQGRPSGDTAGPGEVPSGVNDFAVHPSMKLMLSVGKGEKCMRLWNLVTGKKAGVLNFSKDILSLAGEGRFGTGEGRRVTWDAEGEEFAVGFERGVVVFGIDCKVKTYINPTPRTKVHQLQYLPGGDQHSILAVSTEDGRIMFYDTSSIGDDEDDGEDKGPTAAPLIAQLGGPATGIKTRVKDFKIFSIPCPDATELQAKYIIITASSDGSIRLWRLQSSELSLSSSKSSLKVKQPAPASKDVTSQNGFAAQQVGSVVGTYSTGTRITCLSAFVMTGESDKGSEGNPDPALDSSSEASEDTEAE